MVRYIKIPDAGVATMMRRWCALLDVETGKVAGYQVCSEINIVKNVHPQRSHNSLRPA